ncbi:hypothetical protein EDB86DRAFT_3243652 [Lactarius hatsudake]|nr:hypothetical protein EDB86DRAFT_3243652 [Lactarius hatsudake]
MKHTFGNWHIFRAAEQVPEDILIQLHHSGLWYQMRQIGSWRYVSGRKEARSGSEATVPAPTVANSTDPRCCTGQESDDTADPEINVPMALRGAGTMKSLTGFISIALYHRRARGQWEKESHAHRRSDSVFDGLAVLTGTHWHETTSRSEGARTRTLIILLGHPLAPPCDEVTQCTVHALIVGVIEYRYSDALTVLMSCQTLGQTGRLPVPGARRADHPNFGSRRWRQPSLRLHLSTYFTFLASLGQEVAGSFWSDRPVHVWTLGVSNTIGIGTVLEAEATNTGNRNGHVRRGQGQGASVKST